MLVRDVLSMTTCRVTSCQFFRLRLYVIKAAVTYSFLAYNIAFFTIVFNVFPRLRFQNISLKRDPRLSLVELVGIIWLERNRRVEEAFG